MPDQTDIKTHAALFDDTATCLGVDLECAVMAGDLSMDALADAVLRCATCGEPGACRAWQAAAGHRAAAPVYCRNGALLQGLMP